MIWEAAVNVTSETSVGLTTLNLKYGPVAIPVTSQLVCLKMSRMRPLPNGIEFGIFQG